MQNHTANITSSQLREALRIREQIDSLEGELRACLSPGITTPKPLGPATLTPAQRNQNAAGLVPSVLNRRKRRMSAATRRKLSIAMKNRYAKLRASQTEPA